MVKRKKEKMICRRFIGREISFLYGFTRAHLFCLFPQLRGVIGNHGPWWPTNGEVLWSRGPNGPGPHPRRFITVQFHPRQSNLAYDPIFTVFIFILFFYFYPPFLSFWDLVWLEIMIVSYFMKVKWKKGGFGATEFFFINNLYIT